VENQLSEPPFPIDNEEPEPEPVQKMTASRRLAFMVWDEGCRPGIDPPAETLPPETQNRLEFFAKRVRNATIDEIAKALAKYLDKMNKAAAENILAWKE